MEENKYVYAIYIGENRDFFMLHKTLEGVYNNLSHRNSGEYKLYSVVHGDLYHEITGSNDLYDGCKVAQIQIKSSLHELFGRDSESERKDYEIRAIKLND